MALYTNFIIIAIAITAVRFTFDVAAVKSRQIFLHVQWCTTTASVTLLLWILSTEASTALCALCMQRLGE